MGSSYLLTLMSVGAWQHGAFPIPHESLAIRQTDQSCHHEIWLHLDFVERRNGQAHHERHERRLLLKERSAPYHYSKQKHQTGEDARDHSLSSEIKATIHHRHRRGLPRRRQQHADLHRRAHVSSSRPSAVDLMRRLCFRTQSCVLPFVPSHVTMSIQLFVQLTCVSPKKGLGGVQGGSVVPFFTGHSVLGPWNGKQESDCRDAQIERCESTSPSMQAWKAGERLLHAQPHCVYGTLRVEVRNGECGKECGSKAGRDHSFA